MSQITVTVELHLSAYSSELPKAFGRQIKEVGGRYSSIRGGVTARYVHVPATATELIDALVANYAPFSGKTVLIAREDVDYWENALRGTGAIVYEYNAKTSKETPSAFFQRRYQAARAAQPLVAPPPVKTEREILEEQIAQARATLATLEAKLVNL